MLYIIDNEVQQKSTAYTHQQKKFPGFDPDNLVWWAVGWMKGFITFMKRHKSTQSVSPFIAARSMNIVSSFWREVVLNSFSLFVLP